MTHEIRGALSVTNVPFLVCSCGTLVRVFPPYEGNEEWLEHNGFKDPQRAIDQLAEHMAQGAS